ncbi:uncharacterized protein N7500_004066 [Penicillium coprophilum]|uniref:uncharacterized protein n=1 Tax=Penicillium coprophilum TaxID=36646 RepID=UPI002385F8FF|nr:uncharacterized protein N7500_004066 [Penicillium coprophilum]KAJ5171283.1 hypothetical protein N7500_004066 [Penicillium coprophilum]
MIALVMIPTAATLGVIRLATRFYRKEFGWDDFPFVLALVASTITTAGVNLGKLEEDLCFGANVKILVNTLTSGSLTVVHGYGRREEDMGEMVLRCPSSVEDCSWLHERSYCLLLPPSIYHTVSLTREKVSSGRHRRIDRPSYVQNKFKKKRKTYNSEDSLVVTHPTTNSPACGLSTAERTGSPVFHTLWSYVLAVRLNVITTSEQPTSL